MSLTLSRNQVREVDRRAIADYGMSGLVLMENAGRGTTDVLCPLLEQWAQPEGPVVVVCGKGNNGGDGFVVARHLNLRGVAVKTLLLAEPSELSGDAAANYRILEKSGAPINVFGSPLNVSRFDRELAGAVWLVDALLGTGAVGEPKSPYAEAIDRMNASGVPILAVDLPSGLDCDTGVAASHTIRAARTCTFVAAKPGFIVAGANQYLGTLHVLDIGVPRRLVDKIAYEARS
jgi:NAD(P)H-hydrate epimerase